MKHATASSGKNNDEWPHLFSIRVLVAILLARAQPFVHCAGEFLAADRGLVLF